MSEIGTFLYDRTEGRIDFAGQALVELVSRIVLISSAVIAFIVGFITQSLSLTMTIFGGSTVVLAFVILPAWPIFNSHPVEWLPTVEMKGKENK